MGIATDIGRRAAVLQRAGAHPEVAYWGTVFSPAELHSLILVRLYGIYNVSKVFQDLGDRMAGFAAEVESRGSGYEHMEDALDEELIRVGNQLNDYVRVPRRREQRSAR